jgi:serine/threonine-protein kinase HipA
MIPMSRKANVMYDENLAGMLSETDEGYVFEYDREYIKSKNAKPVSLTLPIQEAKFTSKTMFPFFDGLIPEGWLLDIATENWKLDPKDRMGLLLTVCKDCIGSVSINPTEEENHE